MKLLDSSYRFFALHLPVLWISRIWSQVSILFLLFVLASILSDRIVFWIDLADYITYVSVLIFFVQIFVVFYQCSYRKSVNSIKSQLALLGVNFFFAIFCFYCSIIPMYSIVNKAKEIPLNTVKEEIYTIKLWDYYLLKDGYYRIQIFRLNSYYNPRDPDLSKFIYETDTLVKSLDPDHLSEYKRSPIFEELLETYRLNRVGDAQIFELSRRYKTFLENRYRGEEMVNNWRNLIPVICFIFVILNLIILNSSYVVSFIFIGIIISSSSFYGMFLLDNLSVFRENFIEEFFEETIRIRNWLVLGLPLFLIIYMFSQSRSIKMLSLSLFIAIFYVLDPILVFYLYESVLEIHYTSITLNISIILLGVVGVGLIISEFMKTNSHPIKN